MVEAKNGKADVVDVQWTGGRINHVAASSGLGVNKARLDLALDTTLRPLFQTIITAVEGIVSANRPVEVKIMTVGKLRNMSHGFMKA